MTATHPQSERRFAISELDPPRLSPSLIAGALALNLLGLALPLVILQIYDRVLPNRTTETLGVLIAGLAVVLLVDAALRLGRGILSHWSAAEWEHKGGCAAVSRLLNSRLESLDGDTRGRLLDRLSAIETLRDYYGGQGRLAAIDLPFVALFLGLIWAIAGALVLVPIGMLGLLGLASWITGRKLQHALAQRGELDDRRHSFAIETLNGIRTIKALAAEPFMLRRYERLQQAAAEATHGAVFWSNIAQSLGTLFTGGMLVAVVSFGAFQVMDGPLTIGGLAATTLLAGRAAQPVLRALGLWTQLQSLDLARRKLADIRSTEMPPAPIDDRPRQPISGALTASGLVYSDGDGRTLLDGLRLSVEAGEMVTIAGASGSGKSTLLALLAGDLMPEAGAVSYDGETIATGGAAIRRQIAVVPQNARLFAGTLLENLTFFEESGAFDRALAAAEALGLDQDVQRLPGGWDTRVGEGIADELPASLCQKVAIARAIGRHPRILMLDESNSALDGAADARLRDALSDLRGRTTIVMVTLRPSFQRLADRHFVLVHGRLDQETATTPSERIHPQEPASATAADASLEPTGSDP